MNRHRVVVTGIGVATPLGNENGKFVNALLNGESGAGPITVFDPAALPTRIASEVDDAALPYLCPDRKVAFAVSAARFAVSNAGMAGVQLAQYYDSKASGDISSGVSFGTGLELFSLPDMVRYLNADGIPSTEEHSSTFLQTPSDICLHIISGEHELNAPPVTHISACSASTDALGMAYRMVSEGRRDWMIAGGTDSMINPLGVGGFCLLQALSTRNAEPKAASRPFDRNRDGFLLGEGAAAFILETKSNAEEREAEIYGEIIGYGNSFDAYGISEPHPEGAGAVLAMQRALRDSSISPSEITHINSHGTGTPKNDPIETRAIKKVFGSRSKKIPVNSTKSMIGHLISASGAVEAAATLLCAKQGYIHPTINLDNPDPDCDLDYIPDGKREFKGGYIMKNSFAFGGQNSVLIFKL